VDLRNRTYAAFVELGRAPAAQSLGMSARCGQPGVNCTR